MVDEGSPARGRRPQSQPRSSSAPPAYSDEAEDGVLGAMLFPGEAGRQAREVVLELLGPSDFYRPSRGHVFHAIAELHRSGAPVDAVLVVEHLRLLGLLEAVGRPSVILELLSAAPSPGLATVSRYARLVAGYADRRAEAASAQELLFAVQRGDDVAADLARQQLAHLDSRRRSGAGGRELPGSGPLLSAAEVFDGFVSGLDDSAGALAVPTGVPSLDELLARGGWRPGLVLLGGLPGIGKSAFALQAALHGAAQGHPVLYVSVEQSAEELLGRLFCRELEAPIAAYWNRDPHFLAGVRRAGPGLALDQLYLRSDPFIPGEDQIGTAGRVRRWTEQLTALTGARPLVVIDYLQRMRPPEADRRLDERLRISMAGLGLRQLARDLEVPVVVISSIGRGSYEGLPRLDWFKGSGDLEYDADACVILRPDPECADAAASGAGGRVPVELHVVKNRYGQLTGERAIPLLFDRRFGTFRELPNLARAVGDDPPPPPPPAPPPNPLKLVD